MRARRNVSLAIDGSSSVSRTVSIINSFHGEDCAMVARTWCTLTFIRLRAESTAFEKASPTWRSTACRKTLHALCAGCVLMFGLVHSCGIPVLLPSRSSHRARRRHWPFDGFGDHDDFASFKMSARCAKVSGGSASKMQADSSASSFAIAARSPCNMRPVSCGSAPHVAAGVTPSVEKAGVSSHRTFSKAIVRGPLARKEVVPP